MAHGDAKVAVSSGAVTWGDLDQRRFYTLGTLTYSGLTLLLHPVTVVKTRRQVLSSHQVALLSARRPLDLTYVRSLYRGLPLVLAVAVPARAGYVAVLEESRRFVSDRLTLRTDLAPAAVDAVAGGVAGGVAAVATQLLVVPMDVVSQRQMVDAHGVSVRAVVRDVLRGPERWRGLYRGFGVSLVTAGPTGVVWWAAYGGMKQGLSSSGLHDAAVQCAAGLGAALCAATLTQPLDVVKTRSQVGGDSLSSVAQELFRKDGVRGFWRGLGPRVVHLSLWGTILSSAYEWLKYESRSVAYRAQERESGYDPDR